MTVFPRSVKAPTSRFILPILGLVALGLCIGGILVLIDHHGAENLLASIYDALGNSSGAQALRNGQGDQLIAKLVLMVVALGVGVGGIWLLYLGLGGMVGMLRPAWRDRILPWVFVGPALIMLATYLLYPGIATIARSFFDAKGAFTLDNYAVMTSSDFVEILRNNVIWLIVAAGGSVISAC